MEKYRVKVKDALFHPQEDIYWIQTARVKHKADRHRHNTKGIALPSQESNSVISKKSSKSHHHTQHAHLIQKLLFSFIDFFAKLASDCTGVPQKTDEDVHTEDRAH